MRTSERRLRRIIRNVIRESYDGHYMTDDGIRYSKYEQYEAEVIKTVQDKTLVSNVLNKVCDDISNGNKKYQERDIRRNIADIAVRYLVGNKHSNVASSYHDSGGVDKLKHTIVCWLETILWSVDNFTYEMPKERRLAGWKYYTFSCHVDPSEIPDVNSIDDIIAFWNTKSSWISKSSKK